MKLYFLDLRFDQHGRRSGHIFSSLDDAVSFTILQLIECYEEDSEEANKIGEIVKISVSSPNKKIYKNHIYSNGKILCAGEVEGYEFVIIELLVGESINLE